MIPLCDNCSEAATHITYWFAHGHDHAATLCLECAEEAESEFGADSQWLDVDEFCPATADASGPLWAGHRLTEPAVSKEQ